MNRKRIYSIWSGMLKRCYKPKHVSYRYYGELGIKVCTQWKIDFETFYKWSLVNGYSDTLTIDRKRRDGNYTPSNCRWTTYGEQSRNKSNNVNYNGKCASDLSKELGASPKSQLVGGRLFRGWCLKKAATTPKIDQKLYSNHRGVSYKPDGKRIKRWSATLYMRGKKRCLGVYQTEKEAAEAYNAACRHIGRERRS